MSVPARYRIRRNTASGWSTANPVLAQGEVGLELTSTSVLKAKVGDGVAAWNSLAYFGTGTTTQLLARLDDAGISVEDEGPAYALALAAMKTALEADGGGGGGGSADPFIAGAMVELPDDFLEGTFTEINLVNFVGDSLIGTLPRNAVSPGVPVLIPTTDDNDADLVGLWEVTASGPWIRVDPQPVVGSLVYVGFAQLSAQTGRLAVALSLNGSLDPRLYGPADDQTPNLISYITDDDARDERMLAQGCTEIVARSLVTDPPTQWAVCGNNGTPFTNRWESNVNIPSPEHTLRIRGVMRVVKTDPIVDSDPTFTAFHELAAEELDDPDDIGGVDRYEVAIRMSRIYDMRFSLFAEGTAVGADREWQRVEDGDNGALGSAVSSIWNEVEVIFDFDEHTITSWVRSDGAWTRRDPDDDTTWLLTSTYTRDTIASLRPSDGHVSVIGNGPGLFHIARSQIFCDDVLVQDFDASTADPDDTTVTDSASAGTWTANGVGAVIDGA